MNTLVAVSIVPIAEGEGTSSHVAEAIKVIRGSDLPNKTTSMFTEIEGPWDDVMKVVKEAVMVLADQGIRTEVVLKGDIRPGYEDTMTSKVEQINERLS
ncbi:MAG: MTH1187 family thiamine-binding protein [Alkalibacterium sp.]|uniref:MTH1187 family thiamine-binding protein n=1 Tax=Alkalibacterium sp. TaxID=1872447 RepID=UPI0039708EA8